MGLMRLLLWLRKYVASVLVLAVLVLASYLVFCDRVGRLASLDGDANVVLVGRVEEVIVPAESDAAVAYRLADPTGQVFVVTEGGPPQRGALVIVFGRKGEIGDRRLIVIERRRVGTF